MEKIITEMLNIRMWDLLVAVMKVQPCHSLQIPILSFIKYIFRANIVITVDFQSNINRLDRIIAMGYHFNTFYAWKREDQSMTAI